MNPSVLLKPADRPVLGAALNFLSMQRVLRSCIGTWASAVSLWASDASFDEMVRSTPWQSPADALRAFVVPEGFEVQLVASEPEIGKPVSMSFDVSGRLWIAETRAYPIETATNKGPTDVIRILSDFEKGGRARRNTVFADGLSMPDAVAPFRNGAVVFSIPNVLNLQDTDGDGRADRREVLYGPFGVTDTHNLANNFRRGFDGWFYGGQGVGNQTRVKGTDGHWLEMRGSTFRFRGDGSRIEKMGDGQANVFGLCFDPLGNLFTSDCHSMPIYQVIHGGFYPVFGKPHDGLGYAPQMLWHNHGSTAIAGLNICDEPLWPAEFQGNFLLGNVVTSRVNRDRIEDRGSTRIAHEMPDLVSTSDPWFRPVDVQFGPDGALYIADFYNRIIAHVEVPLSHPGRDRSSGRIWRVVRKATDGRPILRSHADFWSLGPAEQVQRLADPSFAHRLAVLNDLCDRQDWDATTEDSLRSALKSRAAPVSLRVGALWILERRGLLRPNALAETARDSDALLRLHAVRVLVERRSWLEAEFGLVTAALRDPSALVVRAAADALARHPSFDNLAPLLALRRIVPEADTHLVYQVRKALRDQLLDETVFRRLRQEAPGDLVTQDLVADVCLAIPSSESAGFLLEHLKRRRPSDSGFMDQLRHSARHGEMADLETLVGVFRSEASLDRPAQRNLFLAMEQGMAQRGLALGPEMQRWGSDLVRVFLGDAQTTPDLRLFGIEWAGRLGKRDEAPELRRWAGASEAGEPSGTLRLASVRALLELADSHAEPLAESLLRDASVSRDQRAAVAQAVLRCRPKTGIPSLLRVLREVPFGSAIPIAAALGGSPEGSESLLQAVSDGRAPAALLNERSVRDRLLATRPNDKDRFLSRTVADPDSQRRLEWVADRQAAFRKASPDVKAGARVFETHCRPCHSIGGQGGVVGPQLDGVGHRGLERLCEDVLDPNRNVDRIFRYSMVTLHTGDLVTGLFRREEGEQRIYINASGQEQRIPRSEIREVRESETSLMPDNFAENLRPTDFNHLLGFLLSQQTQRP
jgi:putative heme-binding domain-containing protein